MYFEGTRTKIQPGDLLSINYVKTGDGRRPFHAYLRIARKKKDGSYKWMKWFVGKNAEHNQDNIDFLLPNTAFRDFGIDTFIEALTGLQLKEVKGNRPFIKEEEVEGRPSKFRRGVWKDFSLHDCYKFVKEDD